jgi:hypothetical protein
MGTRMPSPHFSQWRAKTAAGRVAGPHVYQEELIAAVALIAEVFEGFQSAPAYGTAPEIPEVAIAHRGSLARA